MTDQDEGIIAAIEDAIVASERATRFQFKPVVEDGLAHTSAGVDVPIRFSAEGVTVSELNDALREVQSVIDSDDRFEGEYINLYFDILTPSQ